jgi:hypothetical protein
METETPSPQLTDPARENRTKGTWVAILNLLLSVSLLLSLVAAWVFIPVAGTLCLTHSRPWWISLVDRSAFLLIPASIVFGTMAVRLSKKEYKGLLRSLGILNILLGVLLILSLVWAEFLYFVCQL